MAIIGVLLRIIALIVMYKISNPKIMPLLPPEPSAPINAPAMREVEQITIKGV